jgi:hypothetical protein
MQSPPEQPSLQQGLQIPTAIRNQWDVNFPCLGRIDDRIRLEENLSIFSNAKGRQLAAAGAPLRRLRQTSQGRFNFTQYLVGFFV